MGSDEALHLLASCYFRAGKTAAAYSVLRTQGCRSPQCRLLFGRCCVDLKKYCEAEQALLSSFMRSESKGQPKADVSIDELVSEFGDSASFVAQLLGFVSVKTERLSRAIDFYCKSLTLNPFLWSSFQSLVQLGHKVDPEKMFTVANVDLNQCYGSNTLISLWNSNRVTECGLPAQTPQTVSLKDNQKPAAVFEINSPFAVINAPLSRDQLTCSHRNPVHGYQRPH